MLVLTQTELAADNRQRVTLVDVPRPYSNIPTFAIYIADMSRFWSDIVNTLTPYTPGEQPIEIDGLIKLNTNENPYGPSPKVRQAIADANGNNLRKYPDPSVSALKTTVANHFDLDKDMVFVGNSSDEVLGHVFRGLLKKQAPLLFPDITYSFYPVYCKLFEIAFEKIPLRDDFTLNIDDYSLNNGGIIFANPNAPTGIALAIDQIEQLLKKNNDSVIVIDEAYVDFAEDSAVRLIKQYPNLLVVQTLSKSRSLAGLRVGFALGQAELIEGLERIKNSFHPYTLDTLAIAGAIEAIKDKEHTKNTCAKINQTRENSRHKLIELGFDVLPSSANFLFVRHPKHQAKRLFEALRTKNIIVRYFDKPRINDYLRISIGTDEQMQTLIQAFNDIIK